MRAMPNAHILNHLSEILNLINMGILLSLLVYTFATLTFLCCKGRKLKEAEHAARD